MMTAELQHTVMLQTLLNGLTDSIPTLAVTGIAIDSRQVQAGDLFLAYQGSRQHGTHFINDAISAGAIAIVTDSDAVALQTDPSIPILVIHDLQKKAGIIASRFFSEPSKALSMYGVTGTNGKTTVSYLLSYALSHCKARCAFIGTLGYGDVSQLYKGNMTTPDPITLHSLLSELQLHYQAVVMEVSSHALDQSRVSGIDYKTAIFTNLSRDHLDYHNTMEDYAASKALLFHRPELQQAIINGDDAFGIELIESLKTQLDVTVYTRQESIYHRFQSEPVSLVYAQHVERNHLRSVIDLIGSFGSISINTSLPAEFNVQNIIAAYAALCVSSIDSATAANAISQFPGIAGRMEYFTEEDRPMLVVDYAHTPDALEKALKTLRKELNGKLYCIFGCGGDRDQGKRAEMGHVAEHYADVIVLTSDNPRSEDPAQIVAQIEVGIGDMSKVTVRLDRSDAIINTYLKAQAEDVILIAGKGHETTQQIGDDILPFSDRELARRLTERPQ